MSRKTIAIAAALASALLVAPAAAGAQGRRQVKVAIDFQHTGDRSRENIGASGRIVIQEGGARPSARLRAGETQTRVTQASRIFTLVQDGGQSILNVATRVPYSEIVFYRDYLTGAGYLGQGLVFENVGSSLSVHATVLPGERIRVRVVPRLSYFAAGSAGAVDVTEAATELVVGSGEPVAIGGVSSDLHEVTRRILGYASSRSENESSLVLTATLQ